MNIDGQRGLNAADAAVRQQIHVVTIEAKAARLNVLDVLASGASSHIPHGGLQTALNRLRHLAQLHNLKTGDNLNAADLYRRIAAETSRAVAASKSVSPLVDFTDVAARDVRLAPTWLSVHGAHVTAAGAYERHCEREGVHPDPKKLAEILGGEQAHLEMTTLRNGLRFVAIKTDSGEQIFEDTTYGGVDTCGCGVAHGGSVVSANVGGTDMGDGFELQRTISSTTYTTCTYQKKFETPTHSVEFAAQIEPPHATSPTGYVSLRVTQSPKRRGDEWLELEFRNGAFELTVYRDLGPHDHKPQLDQISFEFSADGRLKKVVGISAGFQPNPDAQGNDAVLRAMRKGQDKWFQYAGRNEKAQLITKAFFAGDLTRLRLDAKATMDHLIASAAAGEPLSRHEALRF